LVQDDLFPERNLFHDHRLLSAGRTRICGNHLPVCVVFGSIGFSEVSGKHRGHHGPKRPVSALGAAGARETTVQHFAFGWPLRSSLVSTN
jgi:hypothetical protein